MNLNFFDLFSVDCFSEDDDAMDVDSGSAPKPKTDDLAEYNLDDYDKESKSIGNRTYNHFANPAFNTCNSLWTLQQYQRHIQVNESLAIKVY